MILRNRNQAARMDALMLTYAEPDEIADDAYANAATLGLQQDQLLAMRDHLNLMNARLHQQAEDYDVMDYFNGMGDS